MQHEPFANAAITHGVPASGWVPWAPEIDEGVDSHEAGEPHLSLLGAGVSLLMWGCASLLAVWYL